MPDLNREIVKVIPPARMYFVGDAPTVLDPAVQELAHKLSAIHGRIRVTREESGGGRKLFWAHPAVLAENNFKDKSLSNWAFNDAVGCAHGCLFCYVPNVSTTKLGPKLVEYGVLDPDAEWGDYAFLRPWDEKKFLASLRKAEATPIAELAPDGNRAIIFCSTTDAYQTFPGPSAQQRRIINEQARFTVRRALELIRDHSTLRVRILTRSPLARRDFDLFRSFGDRLLFGMSLPTLRNDLARVYEPKAPAPSQRLATLQAAKAAGLHVYVAVAPTYPECDETDLRATLMAVAALDPVTIFHEPINIRGENVKRIEAQAATVGVKLRTNVYATPRQWRSYAVEALTAVERLAREIGVFNRLKLWPDSSLGTKIALREARDPDAMSQWLHHWWSRVSAWPVQHPSHVS